MKTIKIITTNILTLTLLFCWQGEALAEIYKYKDEDGSWKFTDKPPKDKRNARTVSYKSTSGKIRDYQKKFADESAPTVRIQSRSFSIRCNRETRGSTCRVRFRFA